MEQQASSSDSHKIVALTPDDLPGFFDLMSEYAVSLGGSGGSPQLSNTMDGLRQALFDDPPQFEAIMALQDDQPAGLVCWSEAYHIMTGRKTMDIKHLYIRSSARQQSLALSMLSHILKLAEARDYWRVEGEVGGWNTPVQMLFSLLNAERLDHIRFRLQGPGAFLRNRRAEGR